MEGCVPDSSRYVPGRRFDHVSAPQPATGPVLGVVQVAAVVAATADTSAPNDCTRGPWTGGLAIGEAVVHGWPGGVLAINQVTHP
jgi:hypothetical protein